MMSGRALHLGFAQLAILTLIGFQSAGCGDNGEQPSGGDAALDALSETTAPQPPGPTDCVIGSLACACAPGGGCALDPDGEALTCVAGVCLRPTCPSGDLGCECRAGACKAGACVGDMCILEGCAPGSRDCGCASGSCDVGLFCKEGAVCVDSTGYEGGPCLANGSCNTGNRCDVGQGVCVYCDKGTQGCACTDSGTCASGLTCAAGICSAASELPPEAPVCYTPCQRDLPSGGSVRACSSDGLITGCIDDQQCVDGSCVAPGDAKPTCDTDVECPFFQTCLNHGCYSNCESNLDCPSGNGCHKKVCRVPCVLATGGSSCPASMTCDSSDGETGFCVPVLPPTPGEVALPEGTTFSIVGAGSIEMTNLKTEGKLRIAPDGPGTQRITIRKLSHDLYDTNGAQETIESPVDPDTGERLPCSGNATDCPLWWLEMSDGVTTTRGETLEIQCSGTCPVVTIRNGGGAPGVRYNGSLAVTGPGGDQAFAVSYTEEVSGRWEGQVHYFTAFDDAGLEDWLGRSDKSDVEDVANALIQRWGAFRSGNVEGGWPEFEAVLTATRTGSWNQPRVRELCAGVVGGSANAACYPYTNPAGVRVYVENERASPIPSATTELPIAFNIRAQLDDPTTLGGRIDSDTALHYPNNPAVQLSLKADPARPGACDPRVRSACVVYVDGFSAEVSLGARYVSNGASCGQGFMPVEVPWLIPGFTDGTVSSQLFGVARRECRDTELPIEPINDTDRALNADLAAANPSPDRRIRKRSLTLLDGALVNQTDLFLLVRETFESFVPGQDPVSAYAFVTLRRTPVSLDDDAFTAAAPRNVSRTTPEPALACDADLLASLPASVRDDLNARTRVLIEGSSGAMTAFSLDPVTDTDNEIHYLCDGYFDGGGELTEVSVDPFDGNESDTGGYIERFGDNSILLQIPNPCLPGSKVTFFDTGDNFSQLELLEESCQDDGSCENTLNNWVREGLATTDPTWRCIDETRALCDVKPGDLREGKTFFRKRPGTGGFNLPRLSAAVDEAFRYKTRFQSSLNVDAEVGFAPNVCIPGSDAIPYCYDPQAIEDVRRRVDCLVSTYTYSLSSLDVEVQDLIETFLRGNFAQMQGHDGFERLYAELLVMLGDEELTGAFASRFDLAGVATRNFDGAAFELNGINLSGVAGAEMQRLYSAVQYYEMTLDRLYTFGPNIAAALDRGDTSDQANMISPETVTLYLGRLVRASSQLSFAWSEIAKRYRSFNRPGIARRVVERAYARTYMESVMLAQLMLDIAEKTGASFKDQIVRELETAQRTFRVALLDMREVFESIVQGATFFGYPPEYVPFPAVDTSTTSFGANGFDMLLGTARQRLGTAKEREQIAFDSLTSGRLDTTNFQSELVRVRNNYEDQLATLCGVFTGDDGVQYPAIRRYADKSELALVVGDPCALFSNGTIYEQMLEVDSAAAGLDGVLARFRKIQNEIESEKTRVSAQCNLVRSQAQFEYDAAGKVRDVNRDLAITQASIGGAVKLLNAAKSTLEGYQGCIIGIDPASKISCSGLATVSGALGVGAAIAEGVAEGLAVGFQYDIATKQMETGRWVTQTQCDGMLIDSAAKMSSLIGDMDETTLEALRAQINLELQASQVSRYYNEAQRLQERQAEALQQLINVEAARNDPNVRIFRNDSIINADIAFEDAMRAAYRATRMFEYYTSTSYPRMEELFLIRLAARGRPNLENYLTDLENAFQDFEEELGLPDARVAILSLRDDILAIPFLDANKQPVSESERIRQMQAALDDPTRLDKNGYTVLAFGTDVGQLSPLTRNHKIRYIEANVIGSKVGDRLGRIYLRQRGTSVLSTIDDETDYYVFPERTAVVDVFFNGFKAFPAEVYQNLRLRDRPFAHTMWELILNRRDEAVNRDIDMSSVSDIQIFIYYTDFTVF